MLSVQFYSSVVSAKTPPFIVLSLVQRADNIYFRMFREDPVDVAPIKEEEVPDGSLRPDGIESLASSFSGREYVEGFDLDTSSDA